MPVDPANSADWEYFKTLLLNSATRSLVAPYLVRPKAILWEQASQLDLDTTWKKCSAELRPFFALSLLADLLLKGEGQSSPVSNWLTEFAKTTLPPFITLDSATSMAWRFVPALVTQPGSTLTMYFLVGAINAPAASSHSSRPLFPDWAIPFLDDDAQTAINDAFTAARLLHRTSSGTHLYTFPLTCPPGTVPHLQGRQSPQLKITGRSLGLSLGLGALSALSARTMPCHWAATGDVQPDGTINPITSLDYKFNHVHSATTFTLFLYPLANGAALQQSNQLVCWAVGNLETARLWMEHCTSPAALKQITRLQTALQSPDDFIVNCLGLTANAVRDYFIPERKRKLLKWLQNSPPNAEQFADCIEKSLRREDYAHAEALSSLLQPCRNLALVGKTSPGAALSYCSSQLALANHSGNHKESDHWYQQGTAFAEAAQRNMEGKQIYARFVNRRFGVAVRHNSYDFRVNMPQEFMEVLERQQQINKINNYCSDYALGSFLGTLAQNYAFCGPTQLNKTRKTIEAAMRAFGNGKEPGLKEHYLRQCNYLLFALIDAKDFTEAEIQLYHVFGADTGTTIDLEPVLKDGFKLFAMARFLADHPHPPPHHLIQPRQQLLNFMDGGRLPTEFGLPSQIHPWQLIYWNIGRLAMQEQQKNLAQQAWATSMTLCQQGDHTIRPMGLLALAASTVDPPLNEKQRTSAKHILQDLQRTVNSGGLNAAHFQDLLNGKNEEEALKLVHNQPEKFFPFSYR
ncbi:MAG: hypothetical protein Q4G66_12270 [bacterium]|nr:hypothetical protein [bacterium]